MTEPTANDTTPTPLPKPGQTLQRLLIIGIVVALLSGIAAFVQTVRMQKMQTELVHDWESLKEAVHTQAQAAEKFTTDIGTLQQTQHAEQETLAKLQALIDGKQNHWQLREALYMVQLAKLKLEILRDVPTAKWLLNQASERVGELNNAAHDALLADIQALDALPPMDNQKVLLSLRLLIKAVPELPIISPLSTTSTPVTEASSPATSSWKQTWQHSLQTLSSLVRIRDRAAPISPLLSDSEYRLLRESIMLYLSQAEIAVFNANDTLFHEKISQIQTQVSSYFVADAPITQGFLQNLTNLQRLNIAPSLPSLENSVKALQSTVTGSP